VWVTFFFFFSFIFFSGEIARASGLLPQPRFDELSRRFGVAERGRVGFAVWTGLGASAAAAVGAGAGGPAALPSARPRFGHSATVC